MASDHLGNRQPCLELLERNDGSIRPCRVSCLTGRRPPSSRAAQPRPRAGAAMQSTQTLTDHPPGLGEIHAPGIAILELAHHLARILEGLRDLRRSPPAPPRRMPARPAWRRKLAGHLDLAHVSRSAISSCPLAWRRILTALRDHGLEHAHRLLIGQPLGVTLGASFLVALPDATWISRTMALAHRSSASVAFRSASLGCSRSTDGLSLTDYFGLSSDVMLTVELIAARTTCA